jgi:predicted transcriptional regulator
MNPDDIDLSPTQTQLVTALINEHETTEGPVTSGQVADVLDRSAGTVQNQLTTLQSVGLVESVQGPTGGYEPTATAFAVIGRDQRADAETVTVSQEFDRIDATVEEIDLTNVHHPTECTAHVSLQGSIEGIAVGDPVVVGPTPSADLVVAGEVTAVSETGDELVLAVRRMDAPVTEK